MYFPISAKAPFPPPQKNTAEGTAEHQNPTITTTIPEGGQVSK